MGIAPVSIYAAETSFSDVQPGDWYYDSVMEMTSMGLFAGTGNGEFSPNRAMTYAEFLTVIFRYLKGDELAEIPVLDGEVWWEPTLQLGFKYGIVKDRAVMAAPINRENAAQLIVMAAYMQGEMPESVVPINTIPDIAEVGNTLKTNFPNGQTHFDSLNLPTAKRTAVLKAYSFGLMGGIDDSGTFAPHNNLTRAEATAVLYRLINKDARLKVTLLGDDKAEWEKQTLDGVGFYSTIMGIQFQYSVRERLLSGQLPESKYLPDPKYWGYTYNGTMFDTRVGWDCIQYYMRDYYPVPSENQTFVEGEPHNIPQVGDIVIKKDGTQVTLKLGYLNILGAGQGVDIWTGTVYGDGKVLKEGDTNLSFADNSAYKYDAITGEMHPLTDWSQLLLLFDPKDERNGAYVGEVVNNWFRWDGSRWRRIIELDGVIMDF